MRSCVMQVDEKLCNASGQETSGREENHCATKNGKALQGMMERGEK